MSKNGPKKRLGDILIQEGLITAIQLERAVEAQRTKGGKLGDLLIGLGFCTEEDVLSVLSKRSGYGYLTALSTRPAVPPAVLAHIPAALAWSKNLVPVAKEGNVLSVAVADPFAEFDSIGELKIQTGCDIKLVLASESEIQKAVARYYPDRKDVVAAADAGPALEAMDTVIGALVENAAKAGADHIFLEPGAQALHVRYRSKAGLQSRPDIPLAHQASLVARLKTLARLNVGECWVPQVGRLRWTASGRPMDLTVTTLPTSLGEKIVFKLVDADRAMPLDLEKLGLEGESRSQFEKMLELKKGLILAVGPTGSGKSSTLHAALARLSDPSRHLVSVEDPVERYLDGVSQLQARPDARLTLASGVHILRRLGPDVLYVSDLRDLPTAEAALQASSECLVLAALTASSALAGIERLWELGVSAAQLAQALVGVVGQRLVRTVCPHCREPHTFSLRQLMAQGVGSQEMRAAKRADSFTLYRGRGCGQCLGTGFLGAAAVFELLPATDGVRRLIWEKAGRAALARETSERVTLREAAVNKALAGLTTIDEALRVGDQS
ncbi:MAG TPA: ATPase, T2SS/T4P/T4SS family [Elusimicrobiota bacterium]|nr:ATPase, T2SS/T4P/T4SS family [Elusimicrobiota bacterium]